MLRVRNEHAMDLELRLIPATEPLSSRKRGFTALPMRNLEKTGLQYEKVHLHALRSGDDYVRALLSLTRKC